MVGVESRRKRLKSTRKGFTVNPKRLAQPLSERGVCTMELANRDSPCGTTDISRRNTMSKRIANETQAFQVLDTFADSRVTLIKGMKEAGYATLEECEPIVIKWACAKTGAKWDTNNSGKIIMVSSHPKVNSAKTVKRDIMLMLKGTTRRADSNGRTEPTDKVAKTIAAFKKLTPAQQRKVLKALAV